MELNEIKVIKSDERGIIYDCGKVNFLSREKGNVSAHQHNDLETVYLVKGEIELTIADETQIIKAPIMFKTERNVYHKLVSLTDIELVIDRAGE